MPYHAILFCITVDFLFFHAFLFRDSYHTVIVRMNYGSRLLKFGVADSRAGRVVFDSGSSFTYFTQQAYSDLVASVSVLSTASWKVLEFLIT
jgi:hypothetical protein